MKNYYLLMIMALVCQLSFSQKTIPNLQNDQHHKNNTHHEWAEPSSCNSLSLSTTGHKDLKSTGTPTIKNNMVIIDLLIFYSHKNVERLGEARARARLIEGFNKTNEALENSLATFRFRMVGLEKLQTPNNWASLNDALTQIRDYAPAQNRRAELGADAIYYEGTETGCGLAWVRSSKYNMVASGSLNCGTNVMRHELGHNMGLNHGVSNPNHTGGIHFGWSPERTVMGGNSIPYFSNPNVINPATGNPTGVPGKVDGVRFMNGFAPQVSAYFNSVADGEVPDTNTCVETTIRPHIQVNGSWGARSSVTVDENDSVRFGPQPGSGGSWKWTGPNGFSSTQREALISTSIKVNQAGTYKTTYKNTCGKESTHTFTIKVNGAVVVDPIPDTCVATVIRPHIQVNGVWGGAPRSNVMVNENDRVRFGPQPGSGGSWSWTGPNGFTSTQREALVSNSIKVNQGGTYITTYTNTCGTKSTHTFSIKVNGAVVVVPDPVPDTCEATTIRPHIQLNGSWNGPRSSLTARVNDRVRFGPQPSNVGSWSWTGPNGFTSTQREALISNRIQENQAGIYTATYTNTCGSKSTQKFTIKVRRNNCNETPDTPDTPDTPVDPPTDTPNDPPTDDGPIPVKNVETFTRLSLPTWGGTKFVGDQNREWKITHGRESHAINGKSLSLKKSQSISSTTIKGGMSSISVKVKNATRLRTRSLAIIVNGISVKTDSYTGDALRTISAQKLNIKGDVVIQIKNTSSGSNALKIDIDDITWTTNDGKSDAYSNSKNYKVYPLPMQDVLYFDLGKDHGLKQLSISDINGSVILKKSVHTTDGKIDLRSLNLNKGMYFLRISERNESTTLKLIK